MEVMSRNGCKKLDKYTIDEVGIPSLVLMENAANKVFDKIVNLEGKFIVFCGNGNNGGDGLAIARKLILEEKDVCIVIVSKDEKYSADFLININILRKLTKNFIYGRDLLVIMICYSSVILIGYLHSMKCYNTCRILLSLCLLISWISGRGRG